MRSGRTRRSGLLDQNIPPTLKAKSKEKQKPQFFEPATLPHPFGEPNNVSARSGQCINIMNKVRQEGRASLSMHVAAPLAMLSSASEVPHAQPTAVTVNDRMQRKRTANAATGVCHSVGSSDKPFRTSVSESSTNVFCYESEESPAACAGRQPTYSHEISNRATKKMGEQENLLTNLTNLSGFVPYKVESISAAIDNKLSNAVTETASFAENKRRDVNTVLMDNARAAASRTPLSCPSKSSFSQALNNEPDNAAVNCVDQQTAMRIRANQQRAMQLRALSLLEQQSNIQRTAALPIQIPPLPALKSLETARICDNGAEALGSMHSLTIEQRVHIMENHLKALSKTVHVLQQKVERISRSDCSHYP